MCFRLTGRISGFEKLSASAIVLCHDAKRAHRKHLQGITPNVIAVTPLQIVYAHEKTIIHHIELLQELRIPSKLLSEESPLLRTELEGLSSVDPIEVLEDGPRVLPCFLLWVLPAHGAPFEIVGLVNIFVPREKIVHDHEMDLTSSGELDSMKAIESGEEGMRIALDMVMVLL